MRLRVKVLSLVSLVCVVGFVLYIAIQQVTISTQLDRAEENVEQEILRQVEAKRESLERFLRTILSDTQVRTNMLLMKINQYAYLKSDFSPTTENATGGSWFSAASTLLLNPWLDFIQLENEGTITGLYALEPPYVNGFWHFEGAPGVEIFAKYDAKGALVGPFIGVPVWMGPLVDYSQSKIIGVRDQPEGFAFWLLFNPKDILALDTSKLQPTVFDNPIKPLEISVWVKNDPSYQAICTAAIESLKKVHKNLLTPEAQQLYAVLDSPQSQDWLNNKLVPLANQIRDGESIYEKLEKISEDSLDNREIIPVRYEEMSRNWDLHRFIWEFSALFLSGIFGDDPMAAKAPDGFARTQGNNPKGLGFIWEELSPDIPFKLYDPTGISGGFDNDLEKLNGGVGIIYHDVDNRLYIGNRLQLNSLDPQTNKNRSGSIMLGIDASKLLQKVAVATQESIFLVMNNSVLKAYKPDGSIQDKIMLTKEIIQRMKKVTHGITKDGMGNQYIFFRIQPYEDMDMDLFVFKLRMTEVEILQNLARDIKRLLRSLTEEMYVFGVILSTGIMVLLWYLLRSVLRPISTLAEAVQSIGSGKESEWNLKENYTNESDELKSLFSNFEAMLKRMQDGERSRRVLHKFLSPEIAEKILSDAASLHGKQVLATVFFLDFRKFTQLTENMPADQMVLMLNTYFNEIVRILKKYGGLVDKFEGDAVLALWGVPEENPDGPLQAVRAAIEIQKHIRLLNVERKKESKVELEAGIGIHYAKVTEGIMGSEDHSEFTVIGSSVNVTSRICDEAKAGEIWITTNIYDNIIGQIEVESVGEHKLEGISQPYMLYKVKTSF